MGQVALPPTPALPVVANGIVACFAGKIGIGKTTVTKALELCLDWRRVGFGDYVRAELLRRGGNPDLRRDLQDLGQRLVDDDPTALCHSVLSSCDFHPGEDLIVDGVRHAAIFRALVDLVTPSRVCLIYLQADEDVRALRVAERGEVATPLIATHRVEAELDDVLPSVANAVLDAEVSLPVVLARCLDVLEDFGVSQSLAADARAHAARRYSQSPGEEVFRQR